MGRWQRAILAELQSRPVFYVTELLPESHTRAEYVAVLRAVRLLEMRGSIAVDTYQFWACQRGRIVVHRLGHDYDRGDIDQTVWSKRQTENVDKVQNTESRQHFVNDHQEEPLSVAAWLAKMKGQVLNEDEEGTK
jgi:hypothetical protein